MPLLKQILTLITILTSCYAMASNQELDEQISEAANYFSGEISGDIDVLLPTKLDREKLDYSLASLDAVSAWLFELRAINIDSQTEGVADSIIWSGAYVGEVIKRCTKEPYSWKQYEDYMATQNESLRTVIPYTFGTQFILSSKTGAMTLPINKVIRFLEEGPENDLRFYAAAECKSDR
ncbi:hypothetical protein [Ectopseudomonas alcaliphila]|uniref:Uncharacterized protein n=1 Tax=Ectopseudomonas alcaliphila TaxID=101564 RepID=A0ABU4Q0M6_9GAMM|nr:hypothetical protein [Pseudomonas alcaliphila]MDX5993696.1 hypothetical protein [Pseudomonas alcaliphila]